VKFYFISARSEVPKSIFLFCDKIHFLQNSDNVPISLKSLLASPSYPSQQYVIINPLLPIIDLVITGKNGFIIIVIIGNNVSVIIRKNDVITDVKICNNVRKNKKLHTHFCSNNR
jgi:hypothetical protein